MNRKTKKIISILLTILMFATILSTSVFAVDPELFNPSSTNPNAYKSTDTNTTGSIGTFIAACINVAQVVGTGVAIIMLIVLAIKYISAAPNEKAELKKTMTIYVVGAIVLFSASALLGIIKNFALNVSAS